MQSNFYDFSGRLLIKTCQKKQQASLGLVDGKTSTNVIEKYVKRAKKVAHHLLRDLARFGRLIIFLHFGMCLSAAASLNFRLQ